MGTWEPLLIKQSREQLCDVETYRACCFGYLRNLLPGLLCVILTLRQARNLISQVYLYAKQNYAIVMSRACCSRMQWQEYNEWMV